MNERNLKSIGKRTTSEQREITRAGGIKSGEVRRKNKLIKQMVNELLQGEPDGLETIGMFVPEGTTRAALLVEALYHKALAGDVKAFEALMKYSGEDPDQKRKDAELKIKRELLKQQTRKLERYNDVEDLTPLADLLKEKDDEKNAGPTIIFDVLQQIKDAVDESNNQQAKL